MNAGHVECNMPMKDLWARYKPVAMDESWTLITGSGGSNPGVVMPRDTLPPLVDGPETGPREPLPGEVPENAYKVPIPPNWQQPPSRANLGPSLRQSKPQLQPQPQPPGKLVMDVNEWQGGSVKNNLFNMPAVESPKLTKLITQHEPTFLSGKVSSPITTSKSGEKTLASYKILVPIFVPAIKRKIPITTPKPPVRFVKEQITEMVPVKSIVPVKKEVIKAEKVPQQVITDFVRTNGNPAQANPSSKVRSRERILSSTVQNIN